MTTTHTTTLFSLLLTLAAGCWPGPNIDTDTGDGDTGDGDEDGTTGDGDQTAGEAWGPCPIDAASGEPTLCFGEDLACVPADFGEANICLPLGSCPAIPDEFDVTLEIGWGDACYPRCQSDADCADGMVCGHSVADGTPMCAWPQDGMSCDGSLGCPCLDGGVCADGTICATADNDASVCALPLDDTNIPCDHGLNLPLTGISHDGACVAECTQSVDDCGPMTCSPKDAFAQGFCAWPHQSPSIGELWGPCDFRGIDDPDWWGCDGSPGFGLACLRPVSDDGLNICAPQTWDPQYNDDCSDLTAPMGLGVRVQGSAYCVPDCMTDADCGDGMKCSPQSHFCAWVGE